MCDQNILDSAISNLQELKKSGGVLTSFTIEYTPKRTFTTDKGWVEQSKESNFTIEITGYEESSQKP